MKKNRFNTYLDEDLSKKMTAAMELSDAGSESEFIRNAVEFYIGYIFSEKSSDYLSPAITDTMKEIQYSYEKRVSEMLFKTAVELSKINHVLVDSLKITRSSFSVNTLNNWHFATASSILMTVTAEIILRPTR